METTEKTKRIPEDKKETPEDKFEIKAYLKTEFAQLYFPCLSAEAALKNCGSGSPSIPNCTASSTAAVKEKMTRPSASAKCNY